MGNRSKSIRQQVFLEVVLSSNLSVDCVFLIVPSLVRNCILGMNFLQQSKGVINIPEGWIQVRPEVVTNAEEHPYEVPLLTIEENVCDIETEIYRKIEELEGMDQTRLNQLGQLLDKNKEIFTDRPGIITGYQHSFRVTDSTPYLRCV